MENEFLDKVEDNAAVQTCVTQNSLQELKEIWDQWNDEVKQLFYSNYGDLPCLLDIKVNKHLFRALAQFWNPAYSCFTFGRGDLVPTVEEYMALLRCSKIQADRVYSKATNVPTFLKKLEFEGSNSSTPRYEKEDGYLCLECLRLSCIS
ncbi:hypothetical protein Gotur_036109 [Gossypium turneri]